MEKVTALILRPAKGQKVEILIFRHPTAGLQIPAGTVNIGEAPEAAVLREVEEETGLTEVRIVRKLGVEKIELPADQAVLKESLHPYMEPSPSATQLDIELGRGWVVNIGERKGRFTQITYTETKHTGKKQISTATGWVPTAMLDTKMTRHFYWLQPRSETPPRWQWSSDLGYVFDLRWTPLSPAPNLIEHQRPWLKWVANISWLDTLS